MRKFTNSVEHLSRAELTIPLGSQTFSKSKTQYPVGISPLYATKGKGAYIWDIDDNRFIDLVSSLAAVTLGYGDAGMSRAVLKQLKQGVSLSLPSKLEAEVSELIGQLVPSAEMVRFSKNGTDAASAAIRLARAYTGRDHVVTCGYHGWQDWYIGTTSRNKGIPREVSSLSHVFEYNNLNSLNEIFDLHENKIAAVIMEPMNSTYPDKYFLESVRNVTNRAGAVLIFDEIITGFRFSKGGAQELFGIEPDLTAFGKGIANGFPLSAVVGKKEIMSEMQNVFLSGTFGGELLSLAAAKYVLEKHLKEDICGDLSSKGNLLSELVTKAADENGLTQTFSMSGHPTWKFLNWKSYDLYTPEEIKTFFMQEMFQEGILVLNSHNVSQAHSRKIVYKISNAYDRVFKKVRIALETRTLKQQLKSDPLKPLFTLR